MHHSRYDGFVPTSNRDPNEIDRGWSAGFFEKLRGSKPAASEELRNGLAVVIANRRSKRPVRLKSSKR